MITPITNFKTYLIYGILSLFTLPFLVPGFSFAQNDILSEIAKPAQNNESIFKIDSVQESGDRAIKNKNSIIVKITKLLLVLTIALSITMILYNGMIYIIETGQGKEGKSLAKNVAFIVIGIIIALASTVIISLIQSIPNTLDDELKQTPSTDKSILDK